MEIELEAKHLIEKACDMAVSDIHIIPSQTNYTLYFRLNGQMIFIANKDIEWGKRLIAFLKFSSNMDVGERRKPQSGATHLIVHQEAVELRFSTITNVDLLESIVIRVIRHQTHHNYAIQTFFPHDITNIRRLIRRKSGLILFCGPVGSGKTTTIYQLLRERLNQKMIQVITMEDPVEILEPHFLQTEVNEKAEITYDTLIKASLRHHPDILVIGEIRDEETARMVIRGALTGHLMIATIHAKDCQGVIARLLELSISHEQLRQTLIGIVSQRLIPIYCPFCQGSCEIQCTHHHPTHKRMAILEILSGEALYTVLNPNSMSIHYDLMPAHFISLNKKLRKAWSLGFIDDQQYQHFEIL